MRCATLARCHEPLSLGEYRELGPWIDAFSGWRTSTASPAPSAASGASRPTRSRATSSARSCPGAGRRTCSSRTAPASTSTSAAIPSTPRRSATRSTTSSCTTRRARCASRTSCASAEQRLREEGIRGVIYLFKNNTDSAGNSYGCHENYLTSRRDDFSHYQDHLIPFLVSRQIYAGAGKVLQTARGPMYCISQRAEHIWEGVSSATTRSRPIINTRDEPHADAERFRRLHVIVGDSNMSEYATYLKVGATAVLLRMLEDPGVVLRDMALDNPIRAIREISHDTTCRRKVKLVNGRELSALDIQSEYLHRALRYRDQKGLPEQEEQGARHVGALPDPARERSVEARP